MSLILGIHVNATETLLSFSSYNHGFVAFKDNLVSFLISFFFIHRGSFVLKNRNKNKKVFFYDNANPYMQVSKKRIDKDFMFIR